MSTNTKSSPAPAIVKYLKQANEIGQEVFELPGTVRFRITPVSIQLIQDVEATIEEPQPPMWANPEKDGREEPNPSDPEYLRARARATRQRNIAVMDAMVMMGVELVEGLPEDDSWLDKIKQLEKRKMLSLESFDLDDPIDREFLYKRYVIANGEVIELISKAAGVSEEAVREAEASFPGN